MTEGKKTAPRVTAAAVDKKVDALAVEVSELATGVGQLVEMLTEQRAAQVIAEAQPAVHPDAMLSGAEAQANPRTPVGQREGDAVIRNLHSKTVRVRIGKESDPYRINLSPRGEQGDTVAVPASLRGDLGYKRNLGVAFQEISTNEAEALQGRGRRVRRDPETEKARKQAKLITAEESTVARMENTTPEDRFHQIGPRYIDKPGSNNPADSRAYASLDRVDAESDPEYQAFLQFKKMQATGRQGQDFPEAPKTGHDPINDPVRGNDEGSREAQAMQRYLSGLEKKGVLPPGALSKPVTLTRSNVSVQPPNPGGKSRRIPGV